MLYEISCTQGNELTIYVCRDSSEISEAMSGCGKRLGIPYMTLMFSAFSIAEHLCSEDSHPLDFMGIKCRNLPEEEYEKW